MAVRGANPDDDVELARLRWTWRTTERGEQGLSQADFEAAFVRWCAEHRRSHFAVIAERDGLAVGMAWLAIFDRVPGPARVVRRAGNLQSVFVLDGHRNQGIGKLLVEALIDEAKSRDLDWLIVHPSRRSYPFYERFGFVETNRLLQLQLRSGTVADPTE